MATTIRNDTSTPQELSEDSKKSSKIPKYVIFLVLLGVVLFEVIVFGLVFPLSPAKLKSEITPVIEGEIEKSSAKVPYQLDTPPAVKPQERVEKDLGEFNLFDSASGTSEFRISIHFYGLVNKTDVEEFEKRYKENEYRIRNAILVILRSTPSSEINDPMLGVVRNKIIVKVNEILGAPLVKGVIFTDIST